MTTYPIAPELRSILLSTGKHNLLWAEFDEQGQVKNCWQAFDRSAVPAEAFLEMLEQGLLRIKAEIGPCIRAYTLTSAGRAVVAGV